jgi:hypothetical protein
MKKLILLSLVFAGCRTEISPQVREDAPVTKRGPRADAECSVRDYPTATDMPVGSKSLGWVKMERQATDDATFEALRKKVCEMGGDAISQMHWIRAPGASVADPPIELEASAWVTP